MATRASVMDLVRADHKRIGEMFVQLKGVAKGDKKRKALFGELRREISRHDLIEEEMLYSVLKKIPAAQDFLRISIVQHGIIDKLVSRLDSIPMLDTSWDTTFQRLVETFTTHMRHEEKEVSKFLPGRVMGDIPGYLRIA